MIERKNGVHRYFDRNGHEIMPNDEIRYADGTVKKVYLTERGELGTDATNPAWIASGRAVPCEFGIYPLNWEDTEEVEIV